MVKHFTPHICLFYQKIYFNVQKNLFLFCNFGTKDKFSNSFRRGDEKKQFKKWITTSINHSRIQFAILCFSFFQLIMREGVIVSKCINIDILDLRLFITWGKIPTYLTQTKFLLCRVQGPYIGIPYMIVPTQQWPQRQ